MRIVRGCSSEKEQGVHVLSRSTEFLPYWETLDPHPQQGTCYSSYPCSVSSKDAKTCSLPPIVHCTTLKDLIMDSFVLTVIKSVLQLLSFTFQGLKWHTDNQSSPRALQSHKHKVMTTPSDLLKRKPKESSFLKLHKKQVNFSN